MNENAMYIFIIFINTFLSIAPFSFIRYYPFIDKLRFKKSIFLAIFLLLIIIETILIYIFTTYIYLNSFINIELFKISFYIIYFVYSCIVIKGSFSKHFFIWLISFIFSSFVLAIAGCMEFLIPCNSPYLVANVSIILLLFIIMPLGLWFIKKIYSFINNIDKHSCNLLCIMLSTLIIVGIIPRVLNIMNLSPFFHLIKRLIASIGALSSCILLKKIFFYIQLNEKFKLDKLQSEKQLAIQQEQYKNLSEKILGAKAARHDLRHHITALQLYIQQENYDGIKNYLDELNKTIAIKKEFVYCNNSTINMILSYFTQQAIDKNISVDFAANLDDELNIENTDLWVIIGNCLENAIEGCSNLYNDSKFIKLRMLEINNNLSITIDNSFDGIIKKDNDIILSRKRNWESEGIGISSVKSTIKKYNGLLKTEAQDNKFMVSILLPKSTKANLS